MWVYTYIPFLNIKSTFIRICCLYN
jgi:hypothetical protein